MRILCSLLLWAGALAEPLGPAEKASAETLLSALTADPFAEEPLAALERIYRRGPGLPALARLCREREAAEPRLLVVLARIELLQGHRAEGLQALQRAAAVEKDPGQLRRLAKLLDDNGARVAAITAYRASLAGAIPIEQRHLQLRLGTLYLADGKVKEAQAAWEEAKRLGPNDAAVRRQIADALAARREWRAALDELRALEPLESGNPSALVALLRRESEIARHSGDRAEAGRQLARAFAAAAAARQPTLEAELARDLLRLYDVRSSKQRLELLALLAKREAQEPSLAALRGEVLAGSGDAAGAAEAMHAALGVHPDDAYLLRRLASLEKGANRVRELRLLFDVQRSDSALGIELLGALLDTQDKPGAAQVAQTLRQRFPDDATALGEAARLLAPAGLHEEALPLWQRVAALTPGDPDALIGCGDELRALGRADEARAAYSQLARDGSVVSYRQLVATLEKRKLVADAKRAFGEALAHHPDDEALRRDYARWLAANGAAGESVAEWNKLKQSTKDPFLRELAEHEAKRLEWQQMLERQ
jgi:tetratricopeptide (TPR) repeat protein